MGPSSPAVFTVTVTVSPSYGQSFPHGSATLGGLYEPALPASAAAPSPTPASFWPRSRPHPRPPRPLGGPFARRPRRPRPPRPRRPPPFPARLLLSSSASYQ